MMNELFNCLARICEEHAEQLADWPVVKESDPDAIRDYLSPFDFSHPRPLVDLTAQMASGLQQWNVHVPHPRYFGLFNPAASQASVAADALAALFNPQLAVWAHAPFANEVETHVLRYFARQLHYPETASVQFTSGGSEANHAAVLAALAHHFQRYLQDGLAALSRKPVMYISEEGHHSFEKIIKNVGLGLNGLRRITVDSRQQMDVEMLRRQMQEDRANGYEPFMIVATAGTTGTGAVDPLKELRTLADEAGAWLHVDAAWAGTALLVESIKQALNGIGSADSVTMDAHKWLSVSMGAGMFFCRHPQTVQAAFGLQAGYMPSQSSAEPYLTGLQWSRRFIGLKAFMTLAHLGENGIRQQMEQQLSLADLLHRSLQQRGWQVLNESPVGVVCFSHPGLRQDAALTDWLYQLTLQKGDFWLSTYSIRGVKAFRACITSTHTTEEDVEALVDFLDSTLRIKLGCV